MSSSLSTSDADDLHQEPKVIYDTIDWYWDGKKYRTQVRVDCEDRDDILRLTAWYNKRGDYSFSLLYRNSIIIRRWGDHELHRNPDGELIEGPHKHRYKEDYEDDAWAYKTDDVTTSDLRQAFFDFLEEESIELANKEAFQVPLIDFND